MRLSAIAIMSVVAAGLFGHATPSAAQSETTLYTNTGKDRAQACAKARGNAKIRAIQLKREVVKFSKCECADDGQDSPYRWTCVVEVTMRPKSTF